METLTPAIDAHAHVIADEPESVGLLDALGMKLLNLCVPLDAEGRWREDEHCGPNRYRDLARSRPGTFAWGTGFDLPRFGDPGYASRVIAGLDRDFASGAVAVKVWKNIGMELKDPAGRFVQVDHEVFRPIFDHMEKNGYPAVGHLGEPLACWLPLDERSPHFGYYRDNPEWHMHGRAGFPSHGEIMEARDRVLDRHPGLKFVGAHLGSLEYDVAEIAARLDRYPNFAVDTSARVLDLAMQDAGAVREFFMKYQDRILFGTDLGARSLAGMKPDRRAGTLDWLGREWRAEVEYYSTGGMVRVRDREVQGLALPGTVVKKVLESNARRWFPRISL